MISNAYKPTPKGADRSSLVMVELRNRKVQRYIDREEPTLNDMIDDPMTRRLMASDGVGFDHLMGVIATARGKLGK